MAPNGSMKTDRSPLIRNVHWPYHRMRIAYLLAFSFQLGLPLPE
jgi:hypothetical protein